MAERIQIGFKIATVVFAGIFGIAGLLTHDTFDVAVAVLMLVVLDI